MTAGAHADLTRTCGSAGTRVQELPANGDIVAGLEVHEGKVGDLRGVIVDVELIEAHCHSSSAGRLRGGYEERKRATEEENKETLGLPSRPPRGSVVSEIAREVDGRQW